MKRLEMKTRAIGLILGAFSLFQISAFADANNDRYSNTITVNGDADTYYPVVFDIAGEGFIYELNISRKFTDTAPSTWFTSTHKGSLVFRVNLVNNGWGGNPHVEDILKHEYNYSTQIAKAHYVSHRRKYAVWLRGGGANYRMSGSLPDLVSPGIYYTNTKIYDHSNDAYDVYVEPTTTVSIGTIDFDVIRAVDGKVGIGTSSPDNKLDVKGTIRAEEVIVETGWADYVFEDGYELPSLGEVEAHIEEHGRLPGMPSAEQIAERGVSIGESQRMLLEKLEEMTLYMIEKDRQIAALREELAAVRTQLPERKEEN